MTTQKEAVALALEALNTCALRPADDSHYRQEYWFDILAVKRAIAALSTMERQAVWLVGEQAFGTVSDEQIEAVLEIALLDVRKRSGLLEPVQAVPDGWKLVPSKEATWEMTRSAFNFNVYSVKCDCGAEHKGGLSHNKANALYLNMIGLAPQHPPAPSKCT